MKVETSATIRILIADDHPILRKGLVEEIQAHSDMLVVAEAANGREAIDLCKLHRPDIALIDVRMPEVDGITVIERIRQFSPATRSIVLTTAMGDVQMVRAFRVGAHSYLLKNTLRKELVQTIRTVASGQRRILPEVAARMAEHSLDDALSAREIDVLTSASNGRSNKMIADDLRLSEHTVKTHFKNILSKLRANDRTHAVTIALKRGYLDNVNTQ